MRWTEVLVTVGIVGCGEPAPDDFEANAELSAAKEFEPGFYAAVRCFDTEGYRAEIAYLGELARREDRWTLVYRKHQALSEIFDDLNASENRFSPDPPTGIAAVDGLMHFTRDDYGEKPQYLVANSSGGYTLYPLTRREGRIMALAAHPTDPATTVGVDSTFAIVESTFDPDTSTINVVRTEEQLNPSTDKHYGFNGDIAYHPQGQGLLAAMRVLKPVEGQAEFTVATLSSDPKPTQTMSFRHSRPYKIVPELEPGNEPGTYEQVGELGGWAEELSGLATDGRHLVGAGNKERIYLLDPESNAAIDIHINYQVTDCVTEDAILQQFAPRYINAVRAVYGDAYDDHFQESSVLFEGLTYLKRLRS